MLYVEGQCICYWPCARNKLLGYVTVPPVFDLGFQ